MGLPAQSFSDSAWRSAFNFRFDAVESLKVADQNLPENLSLQSLTCLLRLFQVQTDSAYLAYREKVGELNKTYTSYDWPSAFSLAEFRFRHFLYQGLAASHYGEYMRSAKSLLQSYKAHKNLQAHHPAHPVSQLSSGFFAILAQHIPDQLVAVMNTGGMGADASSGYQDLRYLFLRYRSSGSPVATEAALLWLLSLWEFSDNPAEMGQAWEEVNADTGLSSLLITKYLGTMIGFKSGNRQSLATLFDQRMSEEEMDRLPYLYYQRGKFRIFALDPLGVADLRHFLSIADGANFYKSAALRLGWYYQVRREEALADQLYQAALHEGVENTWADQQATRELKQNGKFDRDLLELRMLFDGGNYAAGLIKIQSLDPYLSEKSDVFQTEVWYRKGRCHQGLGQHDEGLQAFDQIFENFREVPNYQVPKSAVIAASMCMAKQDYSLAGHYLAIAEASNKYAYKKTLERQIDAMQRILRTK